jgi:hypothetical protein
VLHNLVNLAKHSLKLRDPLVNLSISNPRIHEKITHFALIRLGLDVSCLTRQNLGFIVFNMILSLLN